MTGGPRRSSVEITCFPAIDMLIAIQTFETPEAAHTFEIDPGWFDAVRTALASDAAETLARIGPTNWTNLGALAVAERWPADVPGFLQRIEALPAERLWLVLASAHVPQLAEAIGASTFERAAAGDAAAREEIARTLRDRFGEEAIKDGLLLLRESAETVRELVLRILPPWYRDVFAPTEARVAAALEADARSKRRMALTMADDALIEAATNGLAYTPEPWARRIVLAPQAAMRPWNVMCAYDDVFLICYPVADESLGIDRSAPPAPLLRLCKALGDDKRLRILRLLQTDSLTLQQIADRVGLAKSSTHHHMVILRSAHLVKTTLEDDSRYTLRHETVPEASALLSAYLTGGSS